MQTDVARNYKQYCIRSSECWFFPFSGHSYLILKLIKRGAVVNAMDYQGTTALHLACQRGQDSAAVSLGSVSI